MSLNAELDELRARIACSLPAGAFERLQAEAATVRASGRLKRARRAGNVAPDFKLADMNGDIVRLAELLKTGPVVLCFYRGDWCGFCGLELQALDDIHREVATLGAALVAIAPQPVETRRNDCAKGLSFPLLVDTDAKVSTSFGVSFTPSADLRDAYAALGRPDAGEAAALPIPATYVVDTSGQIVFSHIDSDFTRRLEPSEILVVLRRLADRAARAVTGTPTDPSPSDD